MSRTHLGRTTRKVSLGLAYAQAYEIRHAADVIRGSIKHVEHLQPGDGAATPTEVCLSLVYTLGRLEKAARRFEEATQ